MLLVVLTYEIWHMVDKPL